jgi:putative methanogenesis marker protein 5
MAKVLIFPYNSLILYDLVKRAGHEPLSVTREVVRRLSGGLHSPPYNVTYDDVKAGLEYCAADVPAGVRGRLAYLAPLIEEAQAAIFIRDPEYAFGSSGCARANEMVWHLVVKKGIPVLSVKYPKNYEEAKEFVSKINSFLKSLR